VKLSQIRGELKYKLQGGQKIKKGVDIKWDLPLLRGRKKRCLNFGQLIV
jgi:hypothetical protein